MIIFHSGHFIRPPWRDLFTLSKLVLTKLIFQNAFHSNVILYVWTFHKLSSTFNSIEIVTVLLPMFVIQIWAVWYWWDCKFIVRETFLVWSGWVIHSHIHFLMFPVYIDCRLASSVNKAMVPVQVVASVPHIFMWCARQEWGIAWK